MPSSSEFGVALLAVREALHMTQALLAQRVGKRPMQIHRWERLGVVPGLEDRIVVLRAMAEAPHELLERLADASRVSLESIGLAPEPAPAAAAPPVVAKTATLDPSAQTIVDDAVREACEEVDMSPKDLRPALSRMLDRMAKAGVPIDAAARMVLGVPKREAREPREAKAPTKP